MRIPRVSARGSFDGRLIFLKSRREALAKAASPVSSDSPDMLFREKTLQRIPVISATYTGNLAIFLPDTPVHRLYFKFSFFRVLS